MRQPRSPELNQQIIDLTLALGSALSKWQEVEGNVFLLFASLARGGSVPNPCTVVYETLIHFEHKIAATDALFKFRVSDTALVEQWGTLLNRTRRKTKIRNKIAHWRIWTDSDDTARPPFLAQHLHRRSTDIKDFGKSSSGAMFAADLYDHARGFAELANDLDAFRRGFLQTKPS